MLKKIVLLLSGMLSSQVLAGENCPTPSFNVPKVDESTFLTFYEKGRIDFDPIRELKNNLPGGLGTVDRKLYPWELIRLPNDEVVFVEDYVGDLNATAKCMALEYGKDLLGDVPLPAEFAEFLQTAQDLKAMEARVKELVEQIKNYDPKKHAEKIAKDYLKEQLKKTIDLENNPSLKALYADVQALKDLGDNFDPIPVPSIPIRTDLDSKTYKDWTATFGKPSQIKADIKASFQINASKTEAQVTAIANAYIEIFKSAPKQVLNAQAIVDAPAKGKVSVESTFWITGIALKPYKGSMDILDMEDNVDHVIVDVYNKFWFAVGPIPVSVTLGASGSAGISWGLYANGVSASAKVAPFVKGDAYMTAGADIIIAEIGVGGRLTIIDATADLKAMANLAFDDDGTPYVENKVTGETNLVLLAGNVFTYVAIPTPVPPFIQRFERSLYDFPGVRVPLPGLAINFVKKGRPGGRFSIEGEADQEDLIAVDLDNYFSQMMTVIDDDLFQTLPMINDETSLSLGYLEDLDRNHVDKSLALIGQWKAN